MERVIEDILIRVTTMAMGKMPSGYVENGKNLWEAFLLGVEYEKEINKTAKREVKDAK